MDQTFEIVATREAGIDRAREYSPA